MKKLVVWGVVLFFVLAGLIQTSNAQNVKSNSGGGYPDPQLSQPDNDYLDRQASVFLDSVKTIISKYPPVIREGKERGYAKLLLDAVFHDKFAAFRKPAQNFYHAQNDRLINELEELKVTKGARIWKVYDMGFIVRTRNVTMAFDLVSGITSGSKEFALSMDEMKRIVSQCDILFISHKHADHAEKGVAEMFLQAGKPVISPDQVWTQDSIFSRIQHPERISEKVHTIELDGNRKLDVIVYPGHQGKSVDNNITLVTTTDGITVAHTGDELNEGDFMIDYEWMDQIAKHHSVDILMPNAWTMDILRVAKGFNPKLILPGHELELGHTVWDRLPYWEMMPILNLPMPNLKNQNIRLLH